MLGLYPLGLSVPEEPNKWLPKMTKRPWPTDKELGSNRLASFALLSGYRTFVSTKDIARCANRDWLLSSRIAFESQL